MRKTIFPNGPTPSDICGIIDSFQYGGHGLFISPIEYRTFARLLEELKEKEEAAPASGSDLDSASSTSQADIQKAGDTACADNTTEPQELPAEEQVTPEAAEVDPRPSAPLYSLDLLNEIEGNIHSHVRDSSSRDILLARFKKMRASGNTRYFADMPADWADQLDRLLARYPNFSAVIQQIRVECQLATLTKSGVLKLPPMLLLGEPGIGKTAFARDLAKTLESALFMHSMETSQNGAGIAGSSRYWSNTRTGLVFDALVDHELINPMFLVDELDKAPQDKRDDPVSAFYQLLEQKQAATFRDESIPEIPIDASHITWIFTANDVAGVAAPILNRLTVLTIPRPNAEQGKIILNTLFEETVAEIMQSIDSENACQLLLDMRLPPEVAHQLALMSVRQAKLKLRSAIAAALANGKNELHIADVIDLASLTVVPGESGLH